MLEERLSLSKKHATRPYYSTQTESALHMASFRLLLKESLSWLNQMMMELQQFVPHICLIYFLIYNGKNKRVSQKLSNYVLKVPKIISKKYQLFPLSAKIISQKCQKSFI